MLIAKTPTYGIPNFSNVPAYSDSEYLPYCQSEKMMPNGRIENNCRLMVLGFLITYSPQLKGGLKGGVFISLIQLQQHS